MQQLYSMMVENGKKEKYQNNMRKFWFCNKCTWNPTVTICQIFKVTDILERCLFNIIYNIFISSRRTVQEILFLSNNHQNPSGKLGRLGGN